MSLPQKQQQQQQQRPQRDPPPALFMHPSPAASHVDVPSTAAGPVITGLPSAQAQQQSHPRSPSSQDPLAAALSTLSTKPMDRTATATATTTNTTTTTAPAAPSRRVPGALPPLQTATATRRESTRATDRTDALWSEMQATLAEVELSASAGTRVFGPEHDRKLASLRAAQIALAQAWAHSEADDAIKTTTAAAAAAGKANSATTTTERGGAGGGASGGGVGELKTDGTAGTADGGPAWSVGTGAGSSSVRPGSSAGGAAAAADRLGQRLEHEMESDLAFARKRREANDQYFRRVNQGVMDVVAKLDDVAVAMKAVEQESKDAWSDESVPSSARP